MELDAFLKRYFIAPAQEKLAADRKVWETAREQQEAEVSAPLRKAEAEAARLAAQEEARKASIADVEARFPEKRGPQEGVESHFNAVFDQYFNQLDQSLV